jgi:cellulose biosynthesis protein BcsQ
MKIISFISAKGGSGKTIITATIANFLGKLGKKILIIDSDGSTNGMTLFYLKEIKEHNANYFNCRGALEDSFHVNSLNYTQLDENIFFLPATYEFVNTDSFNAFSFENNIRSIIDFHNQNVVETFDYILIDCQAGVDIHSEIVVKENISDEIIIVSEFDPISAAGIERLKGLFHKEMLYNRSWVLLNKV